MGENKSDLISSISQTSVMSLTRFLPNTCSFSVFLSFMSKGMAESYYLPVALFLKHTLVESCRLEMLLDWKAGHRQHKY